MDKNQQNKIFCTFLVLLSSWNFDTNIDNFLPEISIYPCLLSEIVCGVTCPWGHIFCPLSVVCLSKAENVLVLWQSKLGARCLSVIWRQTVSRRVHYGRFHCILHSDQITDCNSWNNWGALSAAYSHTFIRISVSMIVKLLYLKFVDSWLYTHNVIYQISRLKLI